MNTHEYILTHWQDTVRDPKNKKDSSLSILKLPNRYTTPCADDGFKNFYYWDTYFTNVGLLADGKIDVARDNVSVMRFFVEKLGFIPNADHLIFGTQPPFYTRAVYDLYATGGEIKDIKENIEFIIEELKFWDYDRNTKIKLNQYKCGFKNIHCEANYDYWAGRVGGFTDGEKKIDRIEMSKNLYAIAESGWDTNFRYPSKRSRFAGLDYVNIDLNCILYDAEIKTAEMLSIIKDDRAEFYRKKSEKRKELIDKYMKNKGDNIYYDYSFAEKRLSPFLSVASLYPYTFGLSKDKKTCEEIFKRLDNEYGIATFEKRDDTVFLQWDYPHMWPSNVYIAYTALVNTENFEDARLLKKQYLSTVDKAFDETGKLWEKYNSITGEVSKSLEYDTPPMMGWTAGVYEFLLKAEK